jgi:hypothetical protein
MRQALVPIVGEDIAYSLSRTATEHKNVGAFNVSVPSGVLVILGEKLAELSGVKV